MNITRFPTSLTAHIATYLPKHEHTLSKFYTIGDPQHLCAISKAITGISPIILSSFGINVAINPAAIPSEIADVITMQKRLSVTSLIVISNLSYWSQVILQQSLFQYLIKLLKELPETDESILIVLKHLPYFMTNYSSFLALTHDPKEHLKLLFCPEELFSFIFTPPYTFKSPSGVGNSPNPYLKRMLAEKKINLQEILSLNLDDLQLRVTEYGSSL